MRAQRTLNGYVIPPLISGGVMLSYRCSNTCRHCLYRCSPERPDEWMTLDAAERVFSALAKERRLESIHLAGGEATLRFELLLDIVRLAVKKRIPLAYLETNAAWCSDPDRTREKLTQLKEAGLDSILVSCSMFHNEFVPFARTRNCIEEALEVFGHYNVIIWLPQFYELLAGMSGENETHSLKEFCERTGLPEWSPQLPGMYGVIPGGRAPEALRRCYTPRPAESFRGEACRGELMSTSHFHIDLYGNLFTGLCAGIAPGNLNELHPSITREAFPVSHTLCEAGPFGLMQLAREECGFEPRPDGYASKCDLCFAARKDLHKTDAYPELQPADYYVS